MRLAGLDLLECTAAKGTPCDGVVILQMISVMFVVIYLKNAREKHSTENKHHRRNDSAKSLPVQHYKTIYNDCFLFCAGQLLRRIIAHRMSGQEELVTR